MVRESKPDMSLRLFVKEVIKGCNGLYITRTNPKHIKIEDEELTSNLKSYMELESISMYWLTDSIQKIYQYHQNQTRFLH